MNRIILSALLLSAQAFAQSATEPCGGPVQVVNGLVRVSKPLAGVPADDECLKAIAAHLATDADIRGVTVELRTPDEQRVGGKALKTAKRAAELLVAGGVANEKVYAVVPRADGEEQGLKISVRSVPPGPPVVQILEHVGEALAGRDEAKLEARIPGAGLSIREVFVTKKGGAVLSLPDSGTLRLGENSVVKVLPPNEKGVPVLAFVRGAAFAETLPSGPGFELVLGEGARLVLAPGSSVDISNATDGWACSVYAGGANFVGQDASGALEIAAGKGVSGQQSLAQTPASLLPAPTVTSTFGKPLEGELEWEAVTGASSYRVEVAHDAAFRASTVTMTSTTTSTPVESTLGSGKFFFRVTPLERGVAGMPSKVYSFTR